jgi:hypothetical protein
VEARRRPRARLAHGRGRCGGSRRRPGHPYWTDVATVFTIHNLPVRGAGRRGARSAITS